MKKYIDRLLREWKQYGKIIIACDYDDTISPWGLEDNDCEKVIEMLKIAKETGAYLVIFTACTKDRYKEIKEFCYEKGLKIDTINQNPIELPYGNDKKIYANIFLDDRAGLKESLNILEAAMYKYRGWKTSQIKLDDVA